MNLVILLKKIAIGLGVWAVFPIYFKINIITYGFPEDVLTLDLYQFFGIRFCAQSRKCNEIKLSNEMLA